MVVTYYIKLFRTEDDRHNSILMSLLLPVAEANKQTNKKKILAAINYAMVIDKKASNIQNFLNYLLLEQFLLKYF